MRMTLTPDVSENSSATRQIARATVTVMVSIVLGQVMGLVAKGLIASTYSSSYLDAFYAANRYSETLFNLVAGGALGSAFIPVFTTCLKRNQVGTAWKLVSSIANLLVIVFMLIGIVSFIWTEPIVEYILAPGFTAEQQVLTAHLLRLLLPTTVIFGLSGLIMGVLNAHQQFLFPALAPSMYQLGLIFGVVFLAKPYGIDGLCLGALVGSALHLLIQVPVLFRLPEKRYSLILGFRLPVVREVIILMLPRLLGVAVVQLNFWLNTFLASSQPDGSVMGINFAFTLMIMPQAAIAQAVAIAALPTFSAQVAQGKKDDMRASLSVTLRSVLLLAIPATVGLILLRFPIIQFIFQRGEFTERSKELVAWALLWYGVGLIGHCVVEVVSRAFYALHDTRTPVIVGVSAMGLNLLFSLLFSAGFDRIGWAPHGGLALANSLATALEMAALLVVMRRRLNGLQGVEIIKGSAKALLAVLFMSVVLVLWNTFASGAPAVIVAAGGVMLGGGVYGVLLWWLKVPEVKWLWGSIRSRLRHSSGGKNER